ncbi:hypothetical protein WH47_00715 [Habropoda laboriosa]|uniref:SHSP domain-containing protein n=1 Tax=Habropoda laboriosa TaxID=597456 RepID=A0A0L7QYJ3_9HYME|nr:hypothetical protein WH47_00715 [Habropoda laboriosa]
MDTRRSRCLKCDGDVITDSGHCSKCLTSLKILQRPPFVNLKQEERKQEPAKMTAKPIESSYVMQIVSSGVREDNVFEAKMMLAPELELSSIKITVKGCNLRVNVCKPLNDEFLCSLAEINEKSIFGDLMRRMSRHCENLLIPEDILIIDMDNLPQHCRENAITLKQNDFMNFEMVLDGRKMSMKFEKVPNFYVIDNKEYYAAEMMTTGLKVETATLATDNMLNIKLHSSDDLSYVKNLNFLIPHEANAKEVSIEILNDTIFMRAPIKKRHT